MTNNIRIFVSYHKEGLIPNRDFIYPIQVGSINAIKHFAGMLHDDDGDNISAKNPMYCELTAQYWAWKNQTADYYGFFHYRRYMSFSTEYFNHNPFQDVEMDYLSEKALDQLHINKDDMERLINQYDVIATTQVNLHDLGGHVESNYDQYDTTPYQYKEDLDTLLEIIKDIYPAYYETAKKYLHDCRGYFCNMFIMKKELFQPYCEWLFKILAEHEKRRDYSNYGPDAIRVSGYLGERLFGIYYSFLKKNKNIRTCELQRTLFKHTDMVQHLTPAFAQNNIAIALAANDGYMPYTGTFIKSIIENSSENYNYDFIILTEDIGEKNKRILTSFIENKPNFSIRFLNPGVYLDGYHLYVRGHFHKETYYRLVLPEVLIDYNKILYLDSDMIALTDIAKLYNENIDGFMIAACHDADTAGLYNGSEPKKKKYMDDQLKLKKPYNYFQAGTIIMNLEEFRKTYTTKEILDYSSSMEFELLDQDILNKLCEGKVKFVDMRWNVMVDFENKRIKEYIRNAPFFLYNMYMNARKDPYIVHYAGPQKPWVWTEMDMAESFWKYARETEYYEWLIGRMIRSRSFEDHGINRTVGIKQRIKDISALFFPYHSKRREFLKKILLLRH